MPRPTPSTPEAAPVAPAIEHRPTSTDRERRLQREAAIDAELAQSFPASDPPGWTLGVAVPPVAVAQADRPVARRPAQAHGASPQRPNVPQAIAIAPQRVGTGVTPAAPPRAPGALPSAARAP